MPHEAWLVERLKNPKMAAAYLEVAIEDGDQGALVLALRHVAQAQGGVRTDCTPVTPEPRGYLSHAVQGRQS